MRFLVRSALQWLADTRLARGVVDALLRGKARRRVVTLDQQSVGRCQQGAHDAFWPRSRFSPDPQCR
jgi:hypothetical protein